MNTKSLKQLDILGGGLRLCNTSRKLEGVIRFNQNKKKFQVYTGEKDIDGNEWLNIVPGVASKNNLGNIKIGDNLFVDEQTGKVNAISVGPSMFYQHIVTVSKYDIPFNQTIETQLPLGNFVKGGSGDFTSIQTAINFIENLEDDKFPRNKENQWLILIAPGVYKENINLLPFISLKGYGKGVTILEPLDDESTQIMLTTDTSISDLSIKFENKNDVNEKNLINIHTQMGRESIPTNQSFFNNTVLIKDVNIDISGAKSFQVIKLESGNLNFEDSQINLNQDELNSEEDSLISCFYLDGGTKLNIQEGKFDFSVNQVQFQFCYSNSSELSLINTFIDIKENLSLDLLENGSNVIIKSLSSDIQIRNSQLKNYSKNGKVIVLEDTQERDIYTINNEDINSLSIISGSLRLKVTSNTVKTNIINKLKNKKGLKIEDTNYKISHINNTGLDFEITLDNDRNLGNRIIKNSNTEEIESQSILRVINSNGNKYVFNNEGIYQYDKKWIMGEGTFILRNVPSAHPIAFLNAGKEELISYVGNNSLTKNVDGVNYNFYSGDVTVTVSGDYGVMSVYCYYHGYMGGENLIIYNNSTHIDILNLNSISNSYLRSNGNIIECSSDNFIIENNNVSKEQGDYSITGDSLVEFNYFNVIHVSKDKGDFNKLSQALNSLGKIDPNLNYMIKVHSGKYIENEPIYLNNLDNVSIIGDSSVNTEIEFNFLNIPDDGVFIHGNSGLLENIKITFKTNEMFVDKVNIIKFVGKSVNLNNIKFDIESNNCDVINLNSCNDVNYLKNIQIEGKYFFNKVDGILNESFMGINSDSSNLLELENVSINLTPANLFENIITNSSRLLRNILLNNTRINGINLSLEMTTPIANSHLILVTENLNNNFNNQIYGNNLSMNSEQNQNYILKNETSGRFLVINSKILGDFSGNNIYTTGSVSFNRNDANVYSYHTALLSNNKESILIGNSAGENTMGNTGMRNILIGKESGINVSSGNDNLIFGNESGSSLTTQNRNTLMGFNTGKQLLEDESVMIGFKSGFSSNKKNLFLGSYSGYNIVGQKNIVLGNNDEKMEETLNEINVDNNIFIGNDSGIKSEGSNNICLGKGSGIHDKGSYNLNLGNFCASGNEYDGEVLNFNTGGNINLGHMAGRKGNNTLRNINIGIGSGEYITNNENISIGYETGRYSKGDNNTIIGNNSGYNLIGSKNVTLGENSLKGSSGITNISNNLVLGNNAGEYVLSSNNVILGCEAGQIGTNKRISNDNILIGYQSGKLMGISTSSLTDAPRNNIFMGKLSGNNSQGSDNIYLGVNSGTLNTEGNRNVFLGSNSGPNVDNSNNGVLIGNNVGLSSSLIEGDVLIGNNCGSSITGTKNSILGFNGGLTTGNNNTLMGYEVGKNSKGDDNTIIGYSSGLNIESDYNVVIGSNSLITKIETGITNDGNVIVGSESGMKITNGGNVMIGYKSGKNNQGTNNTIIGSNAQSFENDQITENNTIIGKDAGKNLRGNRNVVMGNNAGESNNSNEINDNVLIGFDAGKINNKFNNLFILGNNSGKSIQDPLNSYYTESENIIIGNNSLPNANSYGNLVIGNNVGANLTEGENNNLIGEKTGNNLVSGSNNLFLGSGRSLIFRKLTNQNFDISNTYYNSGNQNWELSNVSNPTTILSNTAGSFEFCIESFSTDDKVLGIKSFTTLKDQRFSTVSVNGIQNIINLDGTSGDNQLNIKKFIRNFGGNNWGEYITDEYQDIVPQLSYDIGLNKFTSRQERDDINNSTSYKLENTPIKFSPGDILKINYTSSGLQNEIVVKVYAIIQVIRKENNNPIDFNTITLEDLTQESGNDYRVMDERLYFDLISGEISNQTNFIVDGDAEFTITKIESAGNYNTLGSENMFLGISSGNTCEGEKNLNIGFKSGEHISIGNSNTVIGNKAGRNMNEGENNTIIGENAGQNLSSTGNTIIGRNTAKDIIGMSNNVILGNESGNKLTKSNNIILGNNSSSDKSSIIIGSNNIVNAENSILIGNNLETSTNKNSLILGNKVSTKVRDINADINSSHLYIPVEDALIFGYNDFLQVSEENYLNTVSKTDFYKPSKSIIHKFPKGHCLVEVDDTSSYYELRDTSGQLKHINFLPNTNTSIDLTNDNDFNFKRPVMSIKLQGDTTSSINGIYEIYSLPQTRNNYDFIKIKKLSSTDQSFGLNILNLENTNFSNIEVEINNNILILSSQSGDSPYGRLDQSGNNIYNGGSFITDIMPGLKIERVLGALITDENISNGKSVLDIEGANDLYSIGDIVNIGTDGNTNSTQFSLDYKIISLDSNTVTLNDYIGINTTNELIRLIKKKKKKNIITGNTSNNKLLINGDESDLNNEKATLNVRGSVSLTDFLMLKVSDQSDVNVGSNEAIIWLEENELDNNPILKIKYNSNNGDIKTGIINLSIDS